MSDKPRASFMPELHLPSGTFDISFYTNAFGAVVLRRFDNEDGSVHAAEMSIDGAMFILHEENTAKGKLTPSQCKGSTTTIGLLVDDTDSMMARAIAAGAKAIMPATTYEYGYRQGDILDPFGHQWTIEMFV
jgi:PhnB protein